MALSARLPLALLGALLIAVIVGAIAYNRTREDRWRPLPGGGEIRLVAVKHEGPGGVHFKTKQSILEPLRSRLGSRWDSLLGPPAMEIHDWVGEPTVLVWFQIRNRTGAYWYQNPFQLVRGDRLDEGRWGFSATQGDMNLAGMIFPDDCRNEPRLHIRYSAADGTIDFDIANPLLQQHPHGK
jgi:hypothetical protein